MKKRNRKAVQSLKKLNLKMSLLMKLIKRNLNKPPQINQWTNLISDLYLLGAPWRETLLKQLGETVGMTAVPLGIPDHATAAGPKQRPVTTGRLMAPRMKLLPHLQEANTLLEVVVQLTKITPRPRDTGQEADIQAVF